MGGYVLCLAVSLSMGIAAYSQVKADDFNVKSYASTQWYEMTLEQEQIYQHDHLCCNFDNIDPCCRWAIGEGECENEYMCVERITPHLQTQFQLIGSCAVMDCIILAIVMVLSLGVVISLQIKQFIKKYDGDLPFPKTFSLKTKSSKKDNNKRDEVDN